MTARKLVPALAVLALIPAAPASADQAIAEIGRESPVAAYGGWEAWSAFDQASGSYALTLRDPQGTAKAAPLAPSDQPWDVSLGPDAHGDVVAVYRSCGPDGCDVRRLYVRPRHGGKRGAIGVWRPWPGSALGVRAAGRRSPRAALVASWQ